MIQWLLTFLSNDLSRPSKYASVSIRIWLLTANLFSYPNPEGSFSTKLTELRFNSTNQIRSLFPILCSKRSGERENELGSGHSVMVICSIGRCYGFIDWALTVITSKVHSAALGIWSCEHWLDSRYPSLLGYTRGQIAIDSWYCKDCNEGIHYVVWKFGHEKAVFRMRTTSVHSGAKTQCDEPMARTEKLAWTEIRIAVPHIVFPLSD